MAQFTDDLVLIDRPGARFTLANDFYYQSDLIGLVTVPAGFQTDLASIPQVIQTLLPKVGRWDRAAVVHDYLYTVQKTTRSQADAVLNEAMQVDGVPARRRFEIYWGVRLGGWVAWRQHQNPSV